MGTNTVMVGEERTREHVQEEGMLMLRHFSTAYPRVGLW